MGLPQNGPGKGVKFREAPKLVWDPVDGKGQGDVQGKISRRPWDPKV